MDRKDMIACICILLISTGVGLLIVIWNNTIWTQLLFVVIEVLALIIVVMLHRKSNIYYCMNCGTKVKIGFIPDIESLTLDNGDKILKCKNCKKKVNFRKCEADDVVIIEEGPTVKKKSEVEKEEGNVEEKKEA